MFMPSYSGDKEDRIAEEDIYFNWINFIDEIGNYSTVDSLYLESPRDQRVHSRERKFEILFEVEIYVF